MERTPGGREAEPAALVSALPCLPSSPALQSDSGSRKLLEKEKPKGEREARQSALMGKCWGQRAESTEVGRGGGEGERAQPGPDRLREWEGERGRAPVRGSAALLVHSGIPAQTAGGRPGSWDSIPRITLHSLNPKIPRRAALWGCNGDKTCLIPAPRSLPSQDRVAISK